MILSKVFRVQKGVSRPQSGPLTAKKGRIGQKHSKSPIKPFCLSKGLHRCYVDNQPVYFHQNILSNGFGAQEGTSRPPKGSRATILAWIAKWDDSLRAYTSQAFGARNATLEYILDEARST